MVPEVLSTYAHTRKTQQGRPGDPWGGIDEVFVTIEGQRQERWRTVDQDGDSIDILVQRRRKRRSRAHAR
jgi:putative transposase